MSAFVDDIIDYLNGQSLTIGSTTLQTGVNMFNSQLPDDVTTGIALIETGGGTPDIDIPTHEHTFQVFLRSADYPTGATALELIRNYLHENKTGTGTSTINGVPFLAAALGTNYFLFIHAIAEGGHIGHDEAGRDEFSINFKARTR